ncbi:OmpA family protein [Pseudomonas chlororaphis subsp. aureofaciens]|nr:OmpA family protein [Pseudomonas chlororaphis subsp. aureofaciens]PWY38480.1 hypothetical protein DK261_21470 [Pseudomonas sp. RW409]TSD26146.1 OmpA family protein [Pseudomonas sp. ATCC 13985]
MVRLCATSLISMAPIAAWAVPSSHAFSTQYTSGNVAPAEQVQVIYYRNAETTPVHGAANVYVDREFHNGLLPGSYTQFCLAPGKHVLSSYLDDAPRYLGKTGKAADTNLDAGKIYFYRVDTNNPSLLVSQDTAERELRGSRAQVHALSRASRVEACNYKTSVKPATVKDYTLSGDVLFDFGKSGVRDITREGRDAIRTLAQQLAYDAVVPRRIDVIGHTDPVGSAAANRALGLNRAQTVRSLLIEGGLPANKIGAVSAGSNELLVADCAGSRAEQVACNAQNRRVVIRVDIGATTP